MPVSERTFKKVALEDPEGHWELHCGFLRRKPGMTLEHNEVYDELSFRLKQQLDSSRFRVRTNGGHIRLSAQNYYIPDVVVIPVELQESLRGRRVLEVYNAPLSLVVEVWSRSTGDFDVETKLREYQRQGHLEIWRLHPYDRTLTAWRRQPDGSYTESCYDRGIVHPVALPNVTIDLSTLFN